MRYPKILAILFATIWLLAGGVSAVDAEYTGTELDTAANVQDMALAAFSPAPGDPLVNGKGGNGGGGGGGNGGGNNGGGGDPPPTPDVGWIYYWTGAGVDHEIHRQQADGAANETPAGAPDDYGCTAPECSPGDGSIGWPSHATHDGSRWYLAAAFPSADIVFTGGGGEIAPEIDLVREGVTTGLRLTDSRGECLRVEGFIAGGSNIRWAPDAGGDRDAAVSFAGSRWADLDGDPEADCESFVEAGVFRATLTKDANGAFTGAGPITLAVPMAVNANNEPEMDAFAWTPDGSAIVYSGNSGGIWVASTGAPAGSHSQIVTDSAWEVDWSPDQDAVEAGLQTQIVFTRSSSVRVKGQFRTKWHVETVRPDGSERSEVMAGAVTKNGPDHGLQVARWSPAGTHIAVSDRVIVGQGSTQIDIYRITASGADSTLLHSHLGSSVYLRPLRAWTDVD